MKYLIGLDIGTSSVKGVLMTADGEIVKTAHESFTYTAHENGGLDIAADAFLSVCFSVLRALGKDADIEAVCASSASGNLLLLGRDGQPLTPIYNWQDHRVTTEAKEILCDFDADALYRQIGWSFSYKSMPLAQLCYIKKHTPDLLAGAGKVCMSTEYLYYRLTGKWGITASAGTPFYLLDQESGTYIPQLLAVLGIREDMLPPVMPACQKLGEITAEAAALCGLCKGTPIALGSFDHPSAARGVGVLSEGDLLLSCGTSWVGFFPISSRKKALSAHLLVDPFLSPKGCFGAMFSLPSISEKIKLYVNRYIDDSPAAYKTLASLAAKSEPGAGGLSVLVTDTPDDSLFENRSKEHIARAIMEGTVRLLKEQLDRIKAMGIQASSAVMVGGPSENPMWIKLIEEICHISVRVTRGAYAGAVGAAMQAGIGIGLYADSRDAYDKCREKA